MQDIMKYKCLCCGNYTLPVEPEAAVAFICPVCYWENDVFISSAAPERVGKTQQLHIPGTRL
jgi:hypothetical protein